MKILKDKLSKLSGGRILDVGTGRGEFIKLLSENIGHYDQIVGIDSHQGILIEAKEKLEIRNVELFQMDADRMTFEDESFDMVCLSNTLHHLSDIEGVINEMKRVLKHGGLFIINEMFCDQQNEAQMSHVLVHHIGADIDMITNRMHHQYTYKKEAILEIAHVNSIQIVDTFEFKYDDEVNRNEDYHDEIYQFLIEKLSTIQQSSRYDEIKNRIEDAKKWTHTYGFAGATQMIMIGVK